MSSDVQKFAIGTIRLFNKVMVDGVVDQAKLKEHDPRFKKLTEEALRLQQPYASNPHYKLGVEKLLEICNGKVKGSTAKPQVVLTELDIDDKFNYLESIASDPKKNVEARESYNDMVDIMEYLVREVPGFDRSEYYQRWVARGDTIKAAIVGQTFKEKTIEFVQEKPGKAAAIALGVIATTALLYYFGPSLYEAGKSLFSSATPPPPPNSNDNPPPPDANDPCVCRPEDKPMWEKLLNPTCRPEDKPFVETPVAEDRNVNGSSTNSSDTHPVVIKSQVQPFNVSSSDTCDALHPELEQIEPPIDNEVCDVSKALEIPGSQPRTTSSELTAPFNEEVCDVPGPDAMVVYTPKGQTPVSGRLALPATGDLEVCDVPGEGAVDLFNANQRVSGRLELPSSEDVAMCDAQTPYYRTHQGQFALTASGEPDSSSTTPDVRDLFSRRPAFGSSFETPVVYRTHQGQLALPPSDQTLTVVTGTATPDLTNLEPIQAHGFRPGFQLRTPHHSVGRYSTFGESQTLHNTSSTTTLSTPSTPISIASSVTPTPTTVKLTTTQQFFNASSTPDLTELTSAPQNEVCDASKLLVVPGSQPRTTSSSVALSNPFNEVCDVPGEGATVLYTPKTQTPVTGRLELPAPGDLEVCDVPGEGAVDLFNPNQRVSGRLELPSSEDVAICDAQTPQYRTHQGQLAITASGELDTSATTPDVNDLLRARPRFGSSFETPVVYRTHQGQLALPPSDQTVTVVTGTQTPDLTKLEPIQARGFRPGFELRGPRGSFTTLGGEPTFDNTSSTPVVSTPSVPTTTVTPPPSPVRPSSTQQFFNASSDTANVFSDPDLTELPPATQNEVCDASNLLVVPGSQPRTTSTSVALSNPFNEVCDVPGEGAVNLFNPNQRVSGRLELPAPGDLEVCDVPGPDAMVVYSPKAPDTVSGSLQLTSRNPDVSFRTQQGQLAITASGEPDTSATTPDVSDLFRRRPSFGSSYETPVVYRTHQGQFALPPSEDFSLPNTTPDSSALSLDIQPDASLSFDGQVPTQFLSPSRFSRPDLTRLQSNPSFSNTSSVAQQGMQSSQRLPVDQTPASSTTIPSSSTVNRVGTALVAGLTAFGILGCCLARKIQNDFRSPNFWDDDNGGGGNDGPPGGDGGHRQVPVLPAQNQFFPIPSTGNASSPSPVIKGAADDLPLHQAPPVDLNESNAVVALINGQKLPHHSEDADLHVAPQNRDQMVLYRQPSPPVQQPPFRGGILGMDFLQLFGQNFRPFQPQGWRPPLGGFGRFGAVELPIEHNPPPVDVHANDAPPDNMGLLRRQRLKNADNLEEVQRHNHDDHQPRSRIVVEQQQLAADGNDDDNGFGPIVAGLVAAFGIGVLRMLLRRQ